MDSVLKSVHGIRPLTAAERATLDEFCREMRDVVVPRIAEDVLEREVLAIESRTRFL